MRSIRGRDPGNADGSLTVTTNLGALGGGGMRYCTAVSAVTSINEGGTVWAHCFLTTWATFVFGPMEFSTCCT